MCENAWCDHELWGGQSNSIELMVERVLDQLTWSLIDAGHSLHQLLIRCFDYMGQIMSTMIIGELAVRDHSAKV